MEKTELERLLTDLESDRAERAVSPKDKDKICEAICAFSSERIIFSSPSGKKHENNRFFEQ